MSVSGAAGSADVLVSAVRSAAALATTAVVVAEPITVFEARVHPRTILIRASWWLQGDLAFVHSGITSPLGPLAVTWLSY